MWQVLILSQRNDTKGQCKENCKDLECNQLWEGLIYVASVAETESEIFDWYPEDKVGAVDICFQIPLQSVQPVDLAKKHHEYVNYCVGAVVE